jgi:hypothetical protein
LPYAWPQVIARMLKKEITPVRTDRGNSIKERRQPTRKERNTL